MAEGGVNVNLYLCYFPTEEWASYVIAHTVGKAKGMFAEYWRDCGGFIDVRAKKVVANAVGDAGVYDVDCETLLENGVKYKTIEECEGL